MNDEKDVAQQPTSENGQATETSAAKLSGNVPDPLTEETDQRLADKTEGGE